MAGLEPKFLVEDNNKSTKDATDSHIIQKLQPISSFGELLIDCHQRCDFGPLFECLKSMGQSAIDGEIRSLSTQVTGSPNLLTFFLEAIETALKTNRDFELIQSYLGLFLKIHIEDIVSNEELNTQCENLSKFNDQLWDRLSKQFNKSLCLTNYLRSAVL